MAMSVICHCLSLWYHSIKAQDPDHLEGWGWWQNDPGFCYSGILDTGILEAQIWNSGILDSGMLEFCIMESFNPGL